MILGHTIALDPTAKQEEYFRKACGVARFAYNWGLAEWKRQHGAGEKPSANKLKKQWNAVRRQDFPWSLEVTKCASGQAIMNLGTAFSNFFSDLKKPKKDRHFRYPKFKKRGVKDSFALWNDQFAISGKRIRVPNLGWVRMREALRFDGKIMGAVVSHNAGRWFVSIQVDVAQAITEHERPGSVVGVDLGIATLLTLSRPLDDGRVKIDNPKPRRAYMKRQKRLQRRISRQELLRRKTAAKKSRRQIKRQAQLQILHYRVACIRKDAIHKATSALARQFETIVLEDLNVSGMAKNHSLAGSILDASFGEIRRQAEYKTKLTGGHVEIADRFFASSKICSECGCIADKMPLHVRTWTCPHCGSVHDRDENASKNLEFIVVGQAMPEPPQDDLAATHGEILALAAPKGAVKLRSVNRELNPCSLLSTN